VKSEIKVCEFAKEKGWEFKADKITLHITERGGHMGPVYFHIDENSTFQPYYINPWNNENLFIETEVLRPLRGDFFCLPFGGDNNWNGESHKAHGETACNNWALKDFIDDKDCMKIEFQMETFDRPGNVTKRIMLSHDELNVYSQHTISGFSGPTPMGHHATLRGDTPVNIKTADFIQGMTNPDMNPIHDNREYYSLPPGKKFDDLKKVPTIWSDNPVTDCSIFPNREGFVDIIQLYNSTESRYGWTTAVFQEQGYLWYSLKDVEVLPSTLLWMENKGRHQSPWNGRNCCIGLEDICSYFASGLSKSAMENEINKSGIKTCHILGNEEPFNVNYIQGVVPIPEGFTEVQNLKFKKNQLIFESTTGISVTTKVHYEFILTGQI
jgi:hypothetical protein